MRPLRRYYIEFAHPTHPAPVKLFTLGRTPCAAKNKGFELLELLLKVPPADGETPLPRDNRWRLALQEDRGIAE